MVDTVKGGGRATPPHQAGLFFHHDGMYARKWQLPVCVYSVGGIYENEHIAQVLEGDDLSNFHWLSMNDFFLLVAKLWIDFHINVTQTQLIKLRREQSIQDQFNSIPGGY
jgi:hypothetical protein